MGARDIEMATDGAGNTAMFAFLTTTCPDAARFGYVFLRQGTWDGRRLAEDGSDRTESEGVVDDDDEEHAEAEDGEYRPAAAVNGRCIHRGAPSAVDVRSTYREQSSIVVFKGFGGKDGLAEALFVDGNRLLAEALWDVEVGDAVAELREGCRQTGGSPWPTPPSTP
jgi:hypothetical protein